MPLAIFDMDGVLYRGETALPGVNDLLNALELRNRPYILATNNSMATPKEYVKKLGAMGISVPELSILTSAMATRDYLVETLAPGSGIFVIGMSSLREQIFATTDFRPVQYALQPPDAASAKPSPTQLYVHASTASRRHVARTEP